MRKIERIDIMGLSIDKVSLKETLDIAEGFISSKKPHQIVVLNAAKIVRAKSDKELRKIILSADLVGPDGVPVVWVSKLLGTPLPGRVNGTDLMEELVGLANRKGYSIFFLGATQEIVQKVIEKYKEKYPHLHIAGFRDGYFSQDEEPKIVNEIRNSQADILFVGLPTPMKEKWIHGNLQRLNVPVCHGVGGSFDVVVGHVKRAPLWMQKYGLEWLYRLCQEPKRMFKRYLVTNTIFTFFTIKELVRKFFE